MYNAETLNEITKTMKNHCVAALFACEFDWIDPYTLNDVARDAHGASILALRGATEGYEYAAICAKKGHTRLAQEREIMAALFGE